MGKIDACPQNPSEVTDASERLGCKTDEYGNNQYMCLPDTEKTSFVEFCYEGLMGLKEKGNCLEVSNERLNFRSCKQFIFGCPDEAIRSHEYYKYKACLAIDFRNRCYRLDPSCPPDHNGINDAVLNASKNNTVINVSENFDSDAIIYSVLGSMIILLVAIIVFLLWKKIKIRKEQIRENQFDPESALLAKDSKNLGERGNASSKGDGIESEFTLNDISQTDGESDKEHNKDGKKRKRNDTETSVTSVESLLCEEDAEVEAFNVATKAR